MLTDVNNMIDIYHNRGFAVAKIRANLEYTGSKSMATTLQNISRTNLFHEENLSLF